MRSAPPHSPPRPLLSHLRRCLQTQGYGVFQAEPGTPAQFEIVARSSKGAVLQLQGLPFAVTVLPVGAVSGSPGPLLTQGASQHINSVAEEEKEIDFAISLAYNSELMAYSGSYTIGKEERITQVRR